MHLENLNKLRLGLKYFFKNNYHFILIYYYSLNNIEFEGVAEIVKSISLLTNLKYISLSLG